MAIPFVPPRGRILICDYDLARVAPEIDKQRRVVVVSPRVYNRRHGYDYGRCLVVPFSATCPAEISPACVQFDPGSYASLNKLCWAFCDVVACVSHYRLDQVNIRGRNLQEALTSEDMTRIAEGLKHALGLAQGDF